MEIIKQARKFMHRNFKLSLSVSQKNSGLASKAKIVLGTVNQRSTTKVQRAEYV